MSENETESIEEIVCPYCSTCFDSEDQLSEHLQTYKECKTKFESQLEKLSETVSKPINQDRIEVLKGKLRKKILLELSKTSPRMIMQIKANPEILEDRVNRELFGIALKTKHKVDSLSPIAEKIQTSEFENLRHSITVQRICPKCGKHEDSLKKGETILSHLRECDKGLFDYYLNLGKDEKGYRKYIEEEYPKKKKYEGKPKDELSKEIEQLSKEDLDKLLTKMLRKTMKRK